MAIKKDYKDSDVRTKYKDLVKRQTLTKISVASEEKRSRAELLDMVEELFVGRQKRVDTEKLRAILTMLILANTNSTDDDGGATQAQIDDINRNTSKTGITTSQTNAITANTNKTSFPGFGTSSSTSLVGDTTTITSDQISNITTNNAKVSQGLATANHTLQFDITNTKGNYALVITIVDSSTARPVTKTTTLTLS
jgi:hypothetical protein